MQDKDYLLINDYFLWEIDNRKLRQSKIIPGMTISKELLIYGKDKTYKASSAKFDNYKWNFYNESMEYINVDGFRMAASGNYDLKPADYLEKKFEQSDEIFIKQVAGDIDEKESNVYKTKMRKYIFDFDGDGITETLYTMDNFIFGTEVKKNLTFMFLEKNGQIMHILNDELYNCFNVMEVININGNPFIVILKGLNDLISYKNDKLFIYKIQDNKIVHCLVD